MGYFNGNGDMPIAVLPLTGNEQIPCSTNLPSGEQPQDEMLTPAMLKGFAITPIPLTFAATTVLNAQQLQGAIGQMTLTANLTLSTPTNLVAGQEWFLELTQDGTGNRTLTLTGAGTVFLRAGGSITLSTGANAVDLLKFTCVTAGASPVILVSIITNYS